MLIIFQEKHKAQKERDDALKLNTELQTQNAKLVGHQNQKQKIQLHVRIKEEVVNRLVCMC